MAKNDKKKKLEKKEALGGGVSQTLRVRRLSTRSRGSGRPDLGGEYIKRPLLLEWA